MKAWLLAIAATTVGTFQTANAQQATPEDPPDPTAPETVRPPATATVPPDIVLVPVEVPRAQTAPQPLPLEPPVPEASAFGTGGQLVLSIDLPLMNEGPQFAFARQTTSMGGPSTTTVAVEPSVDCFIAESISIGAQLGITHRSTDYGFIDNPVRGITTSETAFSVEARIGYALPIGDTASIWPRFGVGFMYTRTSYYASASVATGYSVPLALTFPVLWQPGGHFFAGGGPAFVTQLVNKSEGTDVPKTTAYGIVALIGGTIGGS